MLDDQYGVYTCDKWLSDYLLSVGFSMSKEGKKTEVEGKLFF